MTVPSVYAMQSARLQSCSAVDEAATLSAPGALLIGDAGCASIQRLHSVAYAPGLLLQSGVEPVHAITVALQQQRARGQTVRELHLLAHGRPGELRFGVQWIDAEQLKAHAAELAKWEVETIALWSCHVGADSGFVALFEELSGARVYASTT